jgi:hypothetical protein
MWLIPIFLGIGFYVYVKKVFVSQNVVKTKTIRKRRHRKNKFRNLLKIEENNCKIIDDEITNEDQVWSHDYRKMNIKCDVRLVELAYNDLEYNLRKKLNTEETEVNTEETELNTEETEVNTEETELNTEETEVNTEETELNTEETEINETELNTEETKVNTEETETTEINETKEMNENKETNETKEISENKEKISFQKEISSTPINKIIENEIKADNISDTSSNTSSSNLSNEYTNINYDDIKDII